MEWPLNRFDALLVAQTYAGRPMTTHHTIEIDRALEVDRWVCALEQLVRDYPELSSRVVGWARTRRIVVTSDVAGIRARLVGERDAVLEQLRATCWAVGSQTGHRRSS